MLMSEYSAGYAEVCEEQLERQAGSCVFAEIRCNWLGDRYICLIEHLAMVAEKDEENRQSS